MFKKIVIFFILVFVQSSSAQRFDLPKQLYYFQPASSVFGSEAVWTNPGALSTYRASDVQIFADYYEGNYAKNWGTVFTRDGLGVSYRNIKVENDTDIKEYILAGGLNIGRNLNFGASYQYFKDGPSYLHKSHLWNFGFVGKFNQYYKWGLVVSNINRAKVNNMRTETELRYSLAYRPSGSRFTFSADALLSTKTKFKDADFIYHVEMNPIDGLFVNALIDSHQNFEIGLRINFFQSFLGSRRASDKKGNHRGTILYYGSTTEKQQSIVKEQPKRLLTNISGHPQENPSQPFFGKSQQSYLTLLTDIYRAADDNSIGEMLLSLDKVSFGFAQAEELRSALVYFKSKKKRIISHLSYPNNISYYIASVSDKIFIPPVTQLNLVGLRAELTFYAGTLEKLGVKAEILQIGDYKTAAETFTQHESTDANKQQMNRILDTLYNQFVSDIADGRSMTKEEIKDIIDKGPFTTDEALENNLVDGVDYLSELKKNNTDIFSSNTKEITIYKYHSDTLMQNSWKEKPDIAVIVAQGEVHPNGGGSLFNESSDVTPYMMKKAVKQAMQNKNTKGILLRVNSPGGVALTGEEIYHTFDKISEKIPLVISMGNVTASGGYYFSMAGKTLFANKSTMTGSIGIFGGKLDFSEFNKKIALQKEIYSRGKYSAMLLQSRPFTEEERAKYFSHLKSMYNHFVSLVAENRSLPTDSIDNIGQGKVWTGTEAKSNGLVDNIGGYYDALEYIAQTENMEDYNIQIYPQKRPLFNLPGSSLFSFVSKAIASHSVEEIVENELQILTPEQFYTRMPFDINIE